MARIIDVKLIMIYIRIEIDDPHIIREYRINIMTTMIEFIDIISGWH